jgi:hypothetical protein
VDLLIFVININTGVHWAKYLDFRIIVDACVFSEFQFKACCFEKEIWLFVTSDNLELSGELLYTGLLGFLGYTEGLN